MKTDHSGCHSLRVLFIEPPKDFWFILGEYIPPPFGILTLAAYLEANYKDIETEVVDCQAEELNWEKLEKRIDSFQPDLVAPSGLGTCNAYNVIHTANLTKQVTPSAKTVVGGQHFTALADGTLRTQPNIDFIIRGEGEKTLTELTDRLREHKSLDSVAGLSFRHENQVIHNKDRPLIQDLNSLPMPAYHHVQKHMKKYYFALMADKNSPFAIIEGSRGCSNNCIYCSQWRFWKKTQRNKSPQRIADELQHLHTEYGTRFFWLTDDNTGLGPRMNELCDEIIKRKINEEITWFIQARCAEIIQSKGILPKMRKAGNVWVLIGFDGPDAQTLEAFRRKGITQPTAKESVELLKKNGIFAQGTFIIGQRGDSHESIKGLKEYADWLDPDIATFMTLTPFPGTEVYETAKANNWIEDQDWSHYDMIHAIMPTEHLTREEVQKELYECYRTYFGSWNRIYGRILSGNPITRQTYQYLARKAILTNLRNLFP
jgi:anaerobic magnesium-protoporphyrin IX monomethyl ester cyclase